MAAVLCRWASQARRPIRMNWTSKVLNARSSYRPGQFSSSAHCAHPHLHVLLELTLPDFILRSQLCYRERRVAGGHCQGHRWLHEEENHLHIQSKSGGGKTVNPSRYGENYVTQHASTLMLCVSGSRRRVSLTAALHWDQKLPSGSQTWEPPCVWFVPVSSHSPGGGITVGLVERSVSPCSYRTVNISGLPSHRSVTCVWYCRWCVRPAPPISTTWSTWRTSQHVFVITALPNYRKTVRNKKKKMDKVVLVLV